MNSFKKNLPKSWSKIADASRKITTQANISILSLKSDNDYKMFNTSEDEFEFSKNSLARFKAEEKPGLKKSASWCSARCGDGLYDLYSNDSLQAAVTALYAKILIILGLTFPLSEVISAAIAPEYFQLFYVFLFTGSLGYLIFVYVDLLQER